MNKQNGLLGFYASFGFEEEQQETVKNYLWGDNGLKAKLNHISPINYGTDFDIILFQFYVNPIDYLKQNLKEIGNYRRKEKAIGVSIILDNDFFKLSEQGRKEFFKNSINNRIEQLGERVKKSKLDLDVPLLIDAIKRSEI